jgi:hypothetical protein
MANQDTIHHQSGDEKETILQMLDLVKDGLKNTWTMSSKKRKKKTEELEELRTKISALDESQIGLALEASGPASCLPRREFGFARQLYAAKEMKRQLAAALKIVDAQTAGKDNWKEQLDDDMSYDESAQNTEGSDGDLSEDSESVVVTTSNVETKDGPLGVSITTWRRHKFGADEDSADAEADADASNGGSLEEVSISFGDGIVVRATTRTKVVRFADVKPTAEDNIARAKELLRNAKRVKNSL